MNELKNKEDIEKLLKGMQGPEPRAETTRRVMEEAARVIQASQPALRVVAGGPGRRVFWPRRLAVAAGILAVLTGGAVFSLLNSGPYDKVLAGELRAIRDGQAVVLQPGERIRTRDAVVTSTQVTCLLRDGTFIKLDRGSRVVFEKARAGERVHLALQEGRMFLRVAKARGRFVVSGTAGEDVEVLGTIFGVAEQKEGLAVSVFKGRVAVRSAAGELQVAGGQSAQVPAAEKPALTDVDPNRALLWARETTEFRNRPLGDVLRWIELNSSFTFVAPDAVRAEPVTITISEDPMESVIQVLCLACGLKSENEGTKVALKK